MLVPQLMVGSVSLDLFFNVGAIIYGKFCGTLSFKHNITNVGATISGRICGTYLLQTVVPQFQAGFVALVF